MRTKRLLVATLVVLGCCLLSPSALALDHRYPATVERAIDGDTIVVDLYLGLGVILNDQHIRLYGIDAWEITGEEKEKGILAKDYLEGRLKEGKIEIEMRPEWGTKGKDSFGRWLGIVYLDWININIELVEKGHGEEYGTVYESTNERLREEKPSRLEYIFLDARIRYMMRNPTSFLEVDYYYDSEGVIGDSWNLSHGKDFDTAKKTAVLISDNRGIFSDESGEVLLKEFKEQLETIAGYIKSVAWDLDEDIVAEFYSKGATLGYFYQGEYHLWER